jgi:hypothetical protein
MTSNSIALPRIRTKKRKRRPMTSLEYANLIMVIIGVSYGFFNFILFFISLSPWDLIGIINLLIARFCNWPIVLNYIKNGYLDE